jgi:hypothetical protein
VTLTERVPSREEGWQHILLADGDPRGEDLRDRNWAWRFLRYLRERGYSHDELVREVRVELDLPDDRAAIACIGEVSR